MILSYEREFGSAIRRHRVVQAGCATREEFCEKHGASLGGLTEEMLKDIEKGNLLGGFEMSHMVNLINLFWPDNGERVAMLSLAYKVEARMDEERAKTPIDARSITPAVSQEASALA